MDHVKWRCALVFAAAGVAGAWLGAALGKRVESENLLMLFGGLMIVVGALMLHRRTGGEDPDVRLTEATAWRLLPALPADELGRQHTRSVRHERYGWQRGQNQVPRPPTRAFTMGVRQREHRCPSRP